MPRSAAPIDGATARQTSPMTRYAVVGVGGVGGFYGIHLARTGAEVHFLIRSEEPADGVLHLQSGDHLWQVRDGVDCSIHRRWEDLPQVDVAIVAVKATANADVVARLPRILGEGGAVVLVQNGIDAEPAYAAALPHGVDIVGGLAFLAAHRAAPGRFVHVDYGALTLGRYRDAYEPGDGSAAMAALARDLLRAGVAVVQTQDLLAARWQKLVWNIPFNGLTTLLDARTDALMADPAATRLVAGLMAEVVAAASGDGRELPTDLIDRMLAMTRLMRSYAPSMKLDFEHGRPLEVDAMYRAALRRAERSGAAMPQTRMLADALEFLDGRNRREPRQVSDPADR